MDKVKIVGIVSMAVGIIELLVGSSTIAVGYFGLSSWQLGGVKELAFRKVQDDCAGSFKGSRPLLTCSGGNTTCGFQTCDGGQYCKAVSTVASTKSTSTCSLCETTTAGAFSANMTSFCSQFDPAGDASQKSSYASCMSACALYAGVNIYECGENYRNLGCIGGTAALGAVAGSIVGFICACIAGVIGIIVALPAFFNGLWAFLQKESMARTSGGFNIFCAISGFCTSGICTIVVAIAAAIATVIDVGSTSITSASSTCSQACLDSANQGAMLVGDVKMYFDTLTGLLLTLLALSFIGVIVSSVTCCFLGKKM